MDTSSSSAPKVVFRKVDQQWWAYGPSDLVQVGQVIVTKADNTTKTVTVTEVKPAPAQDGQPRVYGKIQPDGQASGRGWSKASRQRRGRKPCVTGGNCSSFGSGRDCGGTDCDGY